MPLGGAKDEHVSCFHSSCQWGLSKLPKWTNLKWISLESYKWGYIFSFSWRGQPLPYVIYGTTWRYWGYPWQCRRAENWMTLLKAICSKTSYRNSWRIPWLMNSWKIPLQSAHLKKKFQFHAWIKKCHFGNFSEIGSLARFVMPW